MPLSLHRREALRTSLWALPVMFIAGAVVLFAVSYFVDVAAFRSGQPLPGWLHTGTASAARQILTSIATTVITVIGLVFLITIVALTLASTQFGPRMLRNFIRDRGTQATLGIFVATFVYCILVLGSIGHESPSFVPHVSVTLALALVLASSGVLIYFIHHIATSIQVPVVIADIATDIRRAIDAHAGDPESRGDDAEPLVRRIAKEGAPVYSRSSGYLQFVEHSRLVELATANDAVVQLLFRPGHFVSHGLPMARVVPPEAADAFAREFDRLHITGPYRTLTQDLTFAIDQVVEIALRALSQAVNDPFTALTCIDWLGDSLCDISARAPVARVHRDRYDSIRIIEAPLPYERLVDRAFDKIRQAGRGMPAIAIRQLAMLARIATQATTAEQREVLVAQADMIWRATEEAVPEPGDRDDVRRRYEAVHAAAAGHGS